MSVTVNGSNGLTFNDGSTQATAPKVGMVNRIINGAMMIDQRNAGASVTRDGTEGYTLDRWIAGDSTDGAFTAQQSSTAPTGFTNSLLITVTSADTSLGATQFARLMTRIEGFNISDLAWGSASASTVTLSFWVRSSVTGTFGGVLVNNAFDRSYPFTYTINAANTFEQKTITITGSTSGTWLTTNGLGIEVCFGLGVGSTYSGTAGSWASAGYISATGATNLMATNGATFYITGVQLEKGSTATSFDYRPYGTELQLCQRYYQQIGSGFYGATEGSSTYNLQVPYWQQMRTSATVAGISGRIFSCRYAGDTNITNPTLANIASGNENVWLQVVSSGLTSGVPIYGRSQNIGSSNFLSASAEL